MKLLKNKIIKNASWIIFAQLLKTILGLLISLLSARYLGPSNYGLINYAASIVAFVTPIMYLGFNNTLVQEIIANPDNEGEILGTSIFMSFISGVLCVVGIISFSMIANSSEPVTKIVCALYSTMLIFQCFELINYWFQSKLMSKYSSIVSLCAYIVVFGYKVFLLVTGKPVAWFAITNTIDVILISILLLFLYNKKSKLKLKISLSLMRGLLSRSKYYIISNLMIVLFAQTDKIMLKLFIDSSAVGYYTSAATCAGLAGMVFSAIIDSMRPSILNCKLKDKALYEKNIITLYSIIIYLSLLYSIVITALSPFIINIFYGDSFSETVPVLQVIVWYGTFSYLGGARDIWILAENKQRHLLIINSLGALINIILNFLLIPKFSALGAAIATVITQFSINVIFVSIYRPTRRTGYLMLKALNPKNINILIK